MRYRTVDWHQGKGPLCPAIPANAHRPRPNAWLHVWPLIALGIVAVVGCGKSDPVPSTPAPTAGVAPPPPPPPPPSAPEPPADAPSENDDTSGDPTDQDASTDDPTTDPDESSNTNEASDETQETATRPDEIDQWQADDYRTALADRDPKLVEAVEHLGRQSIGNSAAVGLLAEMLQSPDAGQAQCIEAIVEALGTNNTSDSRRVLAQLLIGKIPTEDPTTTAPLVLKTLAEHAGPEDEAMLLRVLTDAETLCPEDGPMTAENLRQMTFEAVKPTASPRLRIELAKRLLQPTATDSQKAMFRPWLEENRPENLDAQMLFFGHDDTPDETKAVLEKQFTEAASTAIGLALRIGADEGNVADESEKPDPDGPYRAVEPIWRPAGVAMIEGRLAQLESLAVGASAVMLASVVPVDSTRAALWRAIDTHWEDGPEALVSAGLLTQVTSDPGVVLLLKSAARRPTSRRAGRDVLLKLQETREGWAQSADDAVRTWCERFHAAAGDKPATEPIELSIPLHKDAKVSAHYRADWPSDVGAKLPGVAIGPTEVRYVRIEEKTRLLTTKGFYKRQLDPSDKDLRETDESIRMESFRSVPGTDRKRSIDLTITRADGLADDEPADDAENLVIEILTIEMKDPGR